MSFRVCELFAGVGGFRLALEGDCRCGFSPLPWRVVWSNQWEPGKKTQYASDCYVRRFGSEGHCNEDICTVDAGRIPVHDLLVGGFPCQDYSVAATQARGIEGRKGVLWWEIRRILEAHRPPFVLLENVDRLLKSPANQRGRDMGVLLACFNLLGYAVEWRVLNAADYGFPQRRRRVFILAFRSDTSIARRLRDFGLERGRLWLSGEGFFAGSFPVRSHTEACLPLEASDVPATLPADLQEVSRYYHHRFCNSGVMVDGRVVTCEVEPVMSAPRPLGLVLEPEPSGKYDIPEDDLAQWAYIKGSKREVRRAKSGFEYMYTEGAIPFPDPPDRPARTMLTGEGSRNPNRCTHVVVDPGTGRLRVLSPREAERLNGFPDDWTDTGMPERWRYFCMGNALVVGIVHRMALRLAEIAEPDLGRSERPLPFPPEEVKTRQRYINDR